MLPVTATAARTSIPRLTEIGAADPSWRKEVAPADQTRMARVLAAAIELGTYRCPRSPDAPPLTEEDEEVQYQVRAVDTNTQHGPGYNVHVIYPYTVDLTLERLDLLVAEAPDYIDRARVHVARIEVAPGNEGPPTSHLQFVVNTAANPVPEEVLSIVRVKVLTRGLVPQGPPPPPLPVPTGAAAFASALDAERRGIKRPRLPPA